MNPLFAGLMKEAAHLTRNGRLSEATDAIQRALRGGVEPPPASPVASKPTLAETDVIDVETRVIETEPDTHETPVTPEAPSPREPATTAQWTKGSFAHQGRSIDYMLFVPAEVPGQPVAPRPLVVMLHGCTQGAADFAAGTRMNEHAREHGAIVLYPEQAQRAHGQKCWNWFKSQHQQRGRGEPGLLAALTQHVVEQQQADRRRVYVAGLSAGGAMADVLGHCYPDIYAAIGVHSGLPHGAAHDMMSALSVMKTGASPARPDADATLRPTIVFHGDADTTVHASNGLAVLAGAAPGEVSEGRSPSGRRFTRTLYPASAARGDAEHWRLHAAGHAWSGGSAQGSYTQPDGVDASREMLRFFLAHRLDDAAQG
ncbi:poly(hydroxyalkanoate) depolymerase family esterase [Variovorax boronicumulans]|uniref:extracellular catalytic domain type 1 short-chain-length polyhydroxyalkanoate depolymerase n=1 Tax=Variovorax boronicumulans TaxID=436515 RepID=UPI0024748199|nr:PHB depolymerase family esterase [Variovorax boronicumulans]MDH6169164.1 poly(hydroxyalkanoate) depolymerase family esterase [Variovorax boronicumulans]